MAVGSSAVLVGVAVGGSGVAVGGTPRRRETCGDRYGGENERNGNHHHWIVRLDLE